MAGASARVVECGGFWAGAAARVVVRGGFWAGAAHPRRQKHREMPPPGASAPAFAATTEPASCPLPCKHPRQRRVLGRLMERVLGDVLRERAEDGLRPTSILDFGPELGNHCKVLPVYAILRASILDFRLKLENRCRVFPGNIPKAASILDFMPRLENRCKVFPGNSPKAASILDFMPRLENHGKYCRWQRRMVSPAAAVAATMSASDSILRCREEERFRLQWS